MYLLVAKVNYAVDEILDEATGEPDRDTTPKMRVTKYAVVDIPSANVHGCLAENGCLNNKGEKMIHGGYGAAFSWHPDGQPWRVLFSSNNGKEMLTLVSHV